MCPRATEQQRERSSGRLDRTSPGEEQQREPVQAGRQVREPVQRLIVSPAARGMGNRQIAQALFVTQRTVETYLSRAYQKLAIRSRAELARAFPDVAG